MRRGEIKNSRDTFAQHWARFLIAKRPYITPGTLFDYTTHGDKRLLPAFGDRKLSSIERADIRAWVAKMADTVAAGMLSPKTVNNALTLLSVCFNHAIDEGLIATNPCQRIKRLPEAAFEMDFLRLNEIEPYLAACPDHYRQLAGFLIGTGCRVSEAIAMRWQDVDLADTSVRINRQRDRNSDATTQTKGKRFRRVDIGPPSRTSCDASARPGWLAAGTTAAGCSSARQPLAAATSDASTRSPRAARLSMSGTSRRCRTAVCARCRCAPCATPPPPRGLPPGSR